MKFYSIKHIYLKVIKEYDVIMDIKFQDDFLNINNFHKSPEDVYVKDDFFKSIIIVII